MLADIAGDAAGDKKMLVIADSNVPMERVVAVIGATRASFPDTLLGVGFE